ncbi:hypothetical protein [Halorubrum sp. BV1]|uniref:hypothetical protein n=1 Tax=Halorubrum sp. BV1 TaxID=1498500 RepID=UPI0012BAD91E|nr:hypothetical protein [Halorubrum sp. BV1]
MTEGGAEYGDGTDRRRKAIGREHLLGATVWAYAGGDVNVKVWTTTWELRMPGRLEG